MSKVTIQNLLDSERTLRDSQGRGGIYANYGIDRNIELVETALRPFRAALEQKPMCFAFDDPSLQKTENNEGPEVTDEQRKEGREALEEYLKNEVTFSPYKLKVSRMPNQLTAFSPQREKVNADDLQILNENFTVVLRMLDILED